MVGKKTDVAEFLLKLRSFPEQFKLGDRVGICYRTQARDYQGSVASLSALTAVL